MYVQIACKTMEDAVKAITMVYNGVKDEIDFIQVDYVKVAVDGPYHAEPFTTLEEALSRVHEVVNIDEDNVGIYYNSGRKLFVRVFQGAKVPNNSNYMWQEKPNEV